MGELNPQPLPPSFSSLPN